MTRPHAAAAALLLLLAPPLAQAQGTKPNTAPPDTCTAKAPPPAGTETWSGPATLAAAVSEAELSKAALKPGQSITARFAPVAQVIYRVPPEGPRRPRPRTSAAARPAPASARWSSSRFSPATICCSSPRA